MISCGVEISIAEGVGEKVRGLLPGQDQAHYLGILPQP